MSDSFRVIAIISTFNEADIIAAVIGHLVANGVEVYLIDNHSSDDTVDQAARWLGKGLLQIELFPAERERAVKFEWAAILRRKEELASTLQADWFMHHDADEVRESPWPGLSLKDAIHWVDRLGYNCIDFHVLNFPPTDDGFRPGDDPRTYFKFCEDALDFDRVQRKAWKLTETRVSLAAAGGHEARFPDRRLFPIKFLMRHYPIRGQRHGLKKVFRERTTRFLEAERAEGWHCQYDGIADESYCFVKDPSSLIPFDLEKARMALMVPDQLARNFAAVQAERDELRRHATNLESTREELQQHIFNVEQDRERLRLHAASLEIDRLEAKRQAANLEQEREQLKRRAANLEIDHLEAKRQASNLERELGNLKHHAESLEVELQSVKRLASDLEEARDRLKEETSGLETKLREARLQGKTLENALHALKFHSDLLREWNHLLDGQKSGLERELAAIKGSIVWRAANVMRRRLVGKEAVWGAAETTSADGAKPIFSSLDIPAEGGLTTVTEGCLLRGWACSADGIESVKVFIDGREVSQFVPEIERPDVALVHPAIAGSGRSGFDVTIPLDSIAPGERDLEMVIRSRAGNEYRHHRALLVDGSPYHRLLLARQLSGRERRDLLQTVAAGRNLPRFEIWIDGRAGNDMAPTLKSIAAQTYQNYACHIVADGSGATGALARDPSLDKAQWHSGYDIFAAGEGGTQDYLVFLSPGERLLPDALLHLAARLVKEPASLAYSDHDFVEPTGMHSDPEYAPDWSPEHLLSRNYVGGVFFVRRDQMKAQALDAKGPAWRYDLLLRITEAADRILHIPRVLWSAPLGAPTPAMLAAEAEAVEAALMRRNVGAEVIALPDAPARRVRRRFAAAPRVSMIVPTTGRIDMVRPMVESLLRETSYPNYELLFLDNGRGTHPEGIEFLRSKNVKLIERDEPFNWARLSNAGARACDGELLLFLNDDIEVCDPDWLEELVAQSLVADVGTVGALLLYPDGKIQHGGVFLVDHGGGSRHYLQGLYPKRGIYRHLDCIVREVAANTGACLMVRRTLFDEAGGFDEDFHIAFNDIDFCLRLSERGYRNLWTPHCRLIHHESLSRKGTDVSENERRLWNRWRSRLSIGDPYHNPNLAKDRADCTVDTSALDRRPAPAQEPLQGRGVNLIGYIRAEMGVGQAARGLARAMDAIGIPFTVIDYEHGNPARKGDSTWSHKIVERPVYALNILNVNADLTPEARERLGPGVFEGRYTIGYWVWELPEFPDRWLSSFDHVHEVWVPSEFVRQAVARKSRVPVVRVPYAVEKSTGPFLERPYFKLPEGRFLFLTMYDTYSVRKRKNPEGAIAAFREAFAPDNENVGLILKVNNYVEAEGEKLRELIGDRRNIYLIDRTLSRYEVDSLMACCDCFVSLHRSEGFGLPIAETMALGKAVIVTQWSGNVDFTDESCAACVDYRIQPLGEDYGPYEARQQWAEPNIETAARWMRDLSDDSALARRLGAAGERKISETLSDKSVGDIIRARLGQIAGERLAPRGGNRPSESTDRIRAADD